MKILGIDIAEEKVFITFLKDKKWEHHCLDVADIKKYLKKNFFIGTALKTGDCLIKKESIEVKKKDFFNALKFQKNLASSFQKESLIETVLGKEEDKKREIFFYITKKKFLKEHLDIWKQKYVEPDFTTTVFQAQIGFAKHFFAKIDRMVLLHITKEEIFFTLMEEGLAKEIYHLDIGYESLKEDRREFFKKISQVLYSFLKEEKNKKFPVFFTGKGMEEEKFYDTFLEENKIFISEILTIKTDHLLPYAISMGICLDFLKNKIQFLKEEFLPKKTIRKTINFFIVILGISFISALGIYFYGHKKLQQEKIFFKKNISLLKKIENFSEKKSLADIKKYIDKEAKYFPYLPLQPKVSFLLLYLSKNPHLKNAKINRLEYRLAEYPVKERRTRYKTKVFLEFSASLKEARNFLEDLKKDKNIFTDISYIREEEKHTISFFIKNLRMRELYE